MNFYNLQLQAFHRQEDFAMVTVPVMQMILLVQMWIVCSEKWEEIALSTT